MWQIIVGIILFMGGIGNLTSSLGASFTGIILGGLLIFFGLKKLGILSKFRRPTVVKYEYNKDRTLTEQDFQGVGVRYYEDNIQKLACVNPDWKMTKNQIASSGKASRKIFKYNYINKPVKLVFEPDNPHDPDAIAIIIAGEKVGYIRSDQNLQVRFILESREIKSISAFIGGGEYKFLSDDNEIMKGSYSHSVNIRIKYI